MYIEEIVVDGFKSYATRTVIAGWDPEFNAITGLNGSGKSNILDSICFVLGISNLSQVRAANLQDLVYKRGQAGITKASVTVTFNNLAKQSSPVGFEHCDSLVITRQIVIGGRNKYLINGHLAQQQAIANLFQSVQLNINNPHFLIMQGRITKILNMKPPEILAMIEEAAGTRMFEEKKDKALKTILKKDQKLTEIIDLMDNDIAPKLEKLKLEKQEFMNYQKIEGELERLKRFIVAYDYSQSEKTLEKFETMYTAKETAIQELHTSESTEKEKLTEIDAKITKIQQQKNKKSKNADCFNKLQDTVNDLSKQLTRLSTQQELCVSSVADETANIARLTESKNQMQVQVDKLQTELDTVEAEYQTMKDKSQIQSDQARSQEEFLQTLVTGISGKEGSDNGFADQIQAAQAKKSDAITQAETAKNRVSFLKNSLKQKEKPAKEAAKENSKNTKQVDNLRQDVHDIKSMQTKVTVDDTEFTRLSTLLQNKQQDMERLQEKCQAISNSLGNLRFDYSEPYVGFDHSKVKGLVARLILLDPARPEFTSAIQICAEGRLYCVVVQNNSVATDLLKNGRLKRKYTIIPLDQIVPPKISPDRIETALKLAPGRVHHALSVVGYDAAVKAAMQFVFGGALLCNDAEAAKKAAYHPNVKMRCITIEGDVYEPGATITGGSAPRNSDVLSKIAMLNQSETQLNTLKVEVATLYEHVTRIAADKEKFNSLSASLDHKEYELESLMTVIASSPSGRLLAEIEETKAEIITFEQKAKEFSQLQFECDKTVESLNKEMKEFGSNRNGKLAALDKDVKKKKAEAAASATAVKTFHVQVQGLEQNLEQHQSELTDSQSQIETAQASITKSDDTRKALEDQILEIKSEYDENATELKKLNSMYAKFDVECITLQEERKSCVEHCHEVTLALKKLQYELDNLKTEQEHARSTVNRISREHDWINDQKANFGRADTAYDFQAQNTSECRKRLKQLELEHYSMRKRINVKVMNMIDRVVTKEKSLKQMLATVRRDKSKIEETIEQLDHYKKEALLRTWTQVNRDFGDIFEELLANSDAKLEPPENQTIAEGLEVRVCLGGVWKQSLTELSGGQRSLVALSLILSLLQFKPAPMYVLDEIDAALDLSHTQNIGHLFKTRFKGSQFIVVSLKEGMFNNANVLFKAKFRDGTSVVERFTQNSSAKGSVAAAIDAPASNKENNTNAAAKRSKRARV